jgi:hypothetical protein
MFFILRDLFKDLPCYKAAYSKYRTICMYRSFRYFVSLNKMMIFFARFLSSLKMYSRFAATFLFRSEKKHRNYVSALFCIHTSLQYIASIFSYAVKYSAILLITILKSSWLMLCRHPVPLSDILCIFFLSDILPYPNRKFRHYSV